MIVIMKKIVSAIMSLIMLFLPSCFAFADDGHINGNKGITYSINEYESLKELAQNSKSELMALGYSGEDLTNIINYEENYRNHIHSLQSLTDEQLTNCGYNAEQIRMLRNFQGTDEEMTKLGAELTLNVRTAAFRFTGERTEGGIIYDWKWSGIPQIKMTDAVVVSWNDWIVTSEQSYVLYHNTSSWAYSHMDTGTLIHPDGEPSSYGAGHSFKMQTDYVTNWAQNGGGSIYVQSTEYAKKDFYYFIEYGHSTIKTSIGFSVGFPGGASGSISWSLGVVRQASESGGREAV